MAERNAASPGGGVRASASPFDDEAVHLAALRAGREDAYEYLVRQHGGRMLAVARRFLGESEDAADAVQDAFLSAFRSLDGFEGQARLSTWLHRIVVNAALMKLRSRRRKPEEPIDDLLPAFDPDGHQADPARPWRPLEEVEQRQVRELVLRAIRRLPEGYRTVILLRDIEERDTAETAELLGVNPSVVKTRLHRARQALRALLDPQLRRDDT